MNKNILENGLWRQLSLGASMRRADFRSCWQCGSRGRVCQGWALSWEERLSWSCIIFLVRGEHQQWLCAPGTFAPPRYSDRFEWDEACALRAEIYFVPLVKLLPPLPVCSLNGFSPLSSGAGTTESKLWDCCITHIDHLFTFPTRVRRLINFRWTKADSKPAEICNKSLKWKYNSTYKGGKMPFDIHRWAKIPLQVHRHWTTVNEETNTLAVKKYIKGGEKRFSKNMKQMSLVPTLYFYFLQRIFSHLLGTRKNPMYFMTWRVQFAYQQPGRTWF